MLADEKNAEVSANLLRFGEEPGKHGRGSGGGEVKVVERETQQPVADRAAHKPGFVAGVAEFRGDSPAQGECVLWT